MSIKNIAYIILFLMILVVPPFGVVAGFMFIAVHYMDKDTRKKEEAAREQNAPIPRRYTSYQEELAEKERSAQALSKRNRERNMTIKSDPEEE